MNPPRSWQELEELALKALEAHNFNCEFRKVFTDRTRYEIDVLAKKDNITLAIDCKHYRKTKSRVSVLRREAEKHRKRCEKYAEISGNKVVPVLLTLLDDSLFYMEGCIVVPLRALNDFLLNCVYYVEFFSKANLSVEVSKGSMP